MLEEIKRVRKEGLTATDGCTTIGVDEFKFLVKEAEILQKIRKEAEELYDEQIDLMDFGERVDNIL